MATQTIVRLLDDIDQSDADETVKFGLDGVQYEIDLSAKNAEKLREALNDFVTSARRSTGTGLTKRRITGPARNDSAQNKAIREWAQAQGKKVADRGRVPAEIVAEYEAAMAPAASNGAQTAQAAKGKTKKATAQFSAA
jgi:hypothetical protein